MKNNNHQPYIPHEISININTITINTYDPLHLWGF